MHGQESRTKNQQLKELTTQFDSYRSLNDLDSYFVKNLSQESAARVLNNIKALMMGDDEWPDQETVGEMPSEPTNTHQFLNHVLAEFEQQ